MSHLDGSITDLRDRAFIYTLATTGLRLSEALNLFVYDVDFITQKTTITGKGSKTAEVYWSGQTLEYIRQYLLARQATTPNIDNEPLFIRHDITFIDAPISPSGARKIVKKHAPEFSVHMWRHVAISNFLKSTGNVLATTKFARHASSATTLDRYGHLLDGEVQDLHRKAFE